MSECIPNLLQIEINETKCKNCQNIFSIQDVAENYKGIVATYSNGKCCTLDCMNSLHKSMAEQNE